MRDVLRTDTLLPHAPVEVIPNPIDGELFRYAEKPAELRNRVLLLRPFTSRKYATDVAADAIVELSRQPAFEAFRFSIYGDGELFPLVAQRLARFPNVELHRHFLPQREIPALHAQHGVLLCPTRQDTHGVTMCEGMAGGLVPVTTRNSAIPEFVTDRVSGFLTRSSAEIAERLLELHLDPALFARLSAGAACEVRRKCNLPQVVEQELQLLERVAAAG
jgi:glycosyltransferase involved in cell wall biosynthesis